MFKKLVILLRSYRFKKKTNCDGRPHINGPVHILNGKRITVGKKLCLDRDVKLEVWENGHIEIGSNVFINARSHITSSSSIFLGDDVLIGSDVLISDNNHGKSDSYQELMIPPRQRKLSSKGVVVIEKNVWIGDKVIVLGNVKIGQGSVIGAGSVVTKDIPSFSVAVGNPARVIKKFEEK